MHEVALLIKHAPLAICKGHIKVVIDIVEVVRVPRIIKSSSEGRIGGFDVFFLVLLEARRASGDMCCALIFPLVVMYLEI